MNTRILFLIGLFFAISYSCLGQNDGKCVTGNCVNGTGTFEFTHTDGPATYKGSFKDSKFNGQGTLVIKDQYTYTGSFKDGKMEGKGVVTFSNGDVYTGEMENDDLHGKGIYSYPNGKKFTGTYEKGSEITGKGYIYFSADSTSYEGEIAAGKYNGMGAVTYANGEKFSGHFKDGVLNGAGKWTDTNGEQYDGNFKQWEFDGYGIYKYKDGKIYKGNWADNKRSGNGEYYDENGGLDYSGGWINGKMANPENSIIAKKEQWEDAKKIFSRVTFKGLIYQTILQQNIAFAITDEYHLNSDFSLYGTSESIASIDGTTYRVKINITGTYDPFTKKIHTIPGSSIYRDKFPQGITWNDNGFNGTVYKDPVFPGYYYIKGKTTGGNEFEETDYFIKD